MEFDRVLKDCRIFLAGAWVLKDIGISDGKIAAISHTLRGETENCHGLPLLPGCIDAHVHFRTPGAEHKEDWGTGSMAALHGGITSVLDMPNTDPPTTTRKLLEEKRKLAAKKSRTNFGFHLGATGLNGQELLLSKNYAGVKLYAGASTGSLLVDQKAQQEKVFLAAFQAGKPVLVHAEDEELMKRNAEAAKRKNRTQDLHYFIRSPEAEAKAIAQLLELQGKSGSPLHVCHLSSAAGLELIEGAKKVGRKVSCEVAPHHLFLSKEYCEIEPSKGKVNPSLKSKADTAALWDGLALGSIDLVATDHAPHTEAEKSQGYWEAPSGFPGIETALPLLLHAVHEKRLSLERVQELYCENPARLFEIRGKGSVKIDCDADLVLVDPKREQVLRAEDNFSKCAWTPFEGKKVFGTVEKTWVAGEPAYEAGQKPEKSKGKELLFGGKP